jgi:hypothetical protein
VENFDADMPPQHSADGGVRGAMVTLKNKIAGYGRETKYGLQAMVDRFEAENPSIANQGRCESKRRIAAALLGAGAGYCCPAA